VTLDCTWLSNDDYLREFNIKAEERRIPISGSVDLTHRCNLRCVHCYIDRQLGPGEHVPAEMDTERLLSVIDEITEAGCLYLLLTGGEPLLREDFFEVYRHAKKKGLLLTIFTNGTMVTDEVIGLFAAEPPHEVEISLYGATAETYEKITGVAGSYERCLRGITRLLDNGIHVRLKTILMSLNTAEFHDIEKMAKEFGVKFRFDAAIFPRMSGDRAPLGLRVPPEDAVEREFSDEERLRQWKRYFESSRHKAPGDRLYNCGAGVTGFHIDPYGYLQPCIMAQHIKYDLAQGDFAAGWSKEMAAIRERRAGGLYRCNSCEKVHLCGACPPFFELENGAEDICSEYLCSIGGQRLERLRSACAPGGIHAT
jgi:radical SAM protein with 4Fe4S-binding SPASM domain